MPKQIKITGTIVSDENRSLYEWYEIPCFSPSMLDKYLLTNEDLEITINSGGGNLFSGSEIYTRLKDYKGKVTVKILGIAGSSASIIAMSGDKILMSPVGSLMIHNASCGTNGDKNEMSSTSQMLENIDNAIVNAYIIKTGLTREELLVMMNQETYLNPTEALELKFIDEIMFNENKILNSGTSLILSDKLLNETRNTIKNIRGGEMLKSTILELKIKKLRGELEATSVENIDKLASNISNLEAELKEVKAEEEAEREALKNKTKPQVFKNDKEKVLFNQAKELQNFILTGKEVNNTLSTGSNGAAAVGTELSKEIIRTLKERSNVYDFFNARVGSGNLDLIVITGETDAEWVPEGTDPTDNDGTSTTKVVLKQHRLFKEVTMTRQSVNAAPSEFIAAIVDVVTDAVKNGLEKGLLIGTGTDEPTGICDSVDATRKITSAKLGEVTLKELKEVKSKINQEILAECKWFMNSSAYNYVDNLEDGNGRPLLQPNPSLATEFMLFGVPIAITEAMAEITVASKPTVLIAHPKAYKTNTQRTMFVDTYNDSTYRKKGIVGIACDIFVDGNIQDKSKFAVIENPAT